MSDCSTESMKPKEPPKTCGTCRNQGYCHTFDENRFAEICARFRPVGQSYLDDPDPMEQRCHQLEQVARDALAVISMACSLTNGDPEMRCVNLNCKEAHKSLRSRLEALGVSVDE